MDGKSYACTVGRSGISELRKEGDGSTPAGIFPVKCLYYRPDRLAEVTTALPLIALDSQDGWCDSADNPKYNQYVRLPYPAHCERLWRDDHLYDLIFVLGYNDDPVVPGMGSAIFMHLAAEDFGPTEGCLGLALGDLLEIATSCGPDLQISINQ